MSDEATPAEQSGEPSGSKKLGIKTIAIVAVMMIAEAAGVYFMVSKTATSGASAMSIEGVEEAGRDQTQEILLIEDGFPNSSTGSVWIWKTAIYLQVRNKSAAHVEEIMAQREAEIKEGVARIFRTAEARYLRDDPGLDTITRQLTAYLNDIFGSDADELPLIERVIVPECTGFNTGG